MTDQITSLVERLILERTRRYAVRIEDRASITFSRSVLEGAKRFDEIAPGEEGPAVMLFSLAFEDGWLAFAAELRARMMRAEEDLTAGDIVEILDAELAYRDAAERRRSVPAPLEGKPAENVVSLADRRKSGV